MVVGGLAGCQSATRVIAPKATFQQGEERREVEIRIEPAAPSDGATPTGGDWRRSDGGNEATSQSRHLAISPAPENNNGYEIGYENGGESPAFSYSEAAFVANDNASERRKNKGETGEDNNQNNTLHAAAELPDGLGAGLEGAISEAVRQGSSVHVRVTETRPASSYAEQGAGLTSKSDQAAMEFSTGLRSVVLPWGRAEGGVSGFVGKIAGKSVNVLHGLGGLTLIAAVIPVVLKPRRVGLAAAIAGAGVALIAAGTVAEQAPWVLVLAFIAFVGTLGWLGISAWRSGQLAEGIKPVVAGVEALPEHLQKAVKSSIERKAGAKIDTTRAVVRRAKKQVGIVGKTTTETPPVGTGAAGGG